MIETTLCFECGTDTRLDGYVNRVSCGSDQLECYKCGPCSDTYDALATPTAEDFDEDKWEAYIEDRIDYVDKIFPDAPRFREFMDTEGIWNSTERALVETLVKVYRNNY